MSILRPVAASTVLAVLALVGLIGSVAPATADTSLVGSAPTNGATVHRHPQVVTLEFRDTIVPPALVAVVRPDGSRVDIGDAQVMGNRVQQRLSELPNGAYTVHFRVASLDRHPVLGTVRFSVDAPVVERPSWFEDNGGQLLGVAGFLVLVGVIVALRLRARPAAPLVEERRPGG